MLTAPCGELTTHCVKCQPHHAVREAPLGGGGPEGPMEEPYIKTFYGLELLKIISRPRKKVVNAAAKPPLPM